MKIIGITGGIATGKTVVTQLFAQLGAVTLNADQVVHDLLLDVEVIEHISSQFPGVVENGTISRIALGNQVFADSEKLAYLESLLHPRIRQKILAFLEQAKTDNHKIVALDIPLLFENGLDASCDLIVVTDCEPDLQRKRVLARPGMTEEKFAQIQERQWSEDEKKSQADIILDTSQSIDQLLSEMKVITANLLAS